MVEAHRAFHQQAPELFFKAQRHCQPHFKTLSKPGFLLGSQIIQGLRLRMQIPRCVALNYFLAVTAKPRGKSGFGERESCCGTLSLTGNRKLAIQHIIYSSCSSQPTDWWMASHTRAATPLIFFLYNQRLLIQDNVTFLKGFTVILWW